MSGADKRQQARIQINRPGRIRIGNGPESKTQIIDISEVGAMMFYSQPVPLGTAVELRFSLSQTECVTYGQVRHYSARGESHVIGVQFTHFVPETVEVIRQFISQKSQSSR